MKKLTVFMMCLLLGLSSLVSAKKEMGVFANSNTNSIQFIDPETNNYYDDTPNYLGGELGSYGGGLFDVVITPNGKTAIVSNFGDSRVFFIDISGGIDTPPTLLASVRTGMFAEDMVITPDGQYVLVADGGFSPYVSVILTDPQLIRRNYLGANRYAQAIDITPDGKTVLAADYSGRKVHAFTLNYADGSLTHKKTVKIFFTPVNIAISPDGRTVIAVVAGSPCCVILSYNPATGDLQYGYIVPLPSRNGQSCVFSKNGKKAYYLSNSQTKGTRVHILDVGTKVTPTSTSIRIWPRRGTSQLFGVDTIALDHKEEFLYVTNPTLSGGIADVAVVNLTTNTQIGYIPARGIPTGIAFTK